MRRDASLLASVHGRRAGSGQGAASPFVGGPRSMAGLERSSWKAVMVFREGSAPARSLSRDEWASDASVNA